MTKAAYIRQTVFVFAIFTFFQGLGQGVKIDWVKLPTQNLLPGQSESIVARITNTSTDTTRMIYSEMDLPKGWFGFTNLKKTKGIDPGNSLNAIYSFRIPERHDSLNAGVFIRFFDEEDNLLKEDFIEFTFRKIFAVDVVKLSAVNYVISGQEYNSRYRLKNYGNTPVNLKLRSTEVFISEGDGLFLNPGESKEINIKAVTESGLMRNRKESFRISFIPREFDTTLNYYDRVEIFPDSKLNTPAYKKIPLSISASYLVKNINGEWESAFQGDIFGRKVLNDERGNSLEFHLRGPDRITYSAFGNYEEFYLAYRDRNFGVKLGDQVFQLTRLTEYGRYSRGGSVEVKRGKVSAQAFYGNPRFFPGVKNELGVKTTWKPGNGLSIGSALLRKDFNREDSSAMIPSVFVEWDRNNVKVESELAGDWDSGQPSFGYFGAVKNRVKDFYFNANVLHSGPGFSGYFSNSTSFNSNLTYSLPQTSFLLSANYINSNPSLDTLFVSAPLSQNITGTVSWRIRDRSFFRVNTGYRRRKDRLRLDLFDYSETYFRVNYNYRQRDFNFRVFSEIGLTENLKASEPDQTLGYNIGGFVDYRVLSDLRLSANFSYFNNQRYSQDRYQAFLFGGRLYWSLEDKLRFNISYQNNYNPETYYQNQDFFQMSIEVSPHPKHTLEISSRYSKPRNQDRNIFFGSVGYTWQLGIPYQKRSNLGSISGVLRDADGFPVAGVILHLNGLKTISDSGGAYEFKNLKPGTYILFPEENSINPGLVPGISLPVTIALGENEDRIFDFYFVEGGTILGALSLQSNRVHILENKINLENPVYIKIANGDTEIVQSCKLNRRFRFTNLRPGKWTVEIMGFSIDKNILFNQLEQEVVIAENEVAEIEFEAKRKVREVKMIDKPMKISSNKE